MLLCSNVQSLEELQGVVHGKRVNAKWLGVAWIERGEDDEIILSGWESGRVLVEIPWATVAGRKQVAKEGGVRHHCERCYREKWQ